jgi:hypothetical protein
MMTDSACTPPLSPEALPYNSGERWRHYSAGLRSCQEGIIVKKAAFLGLGRPLELRGVDRNIRANKEHGR